MSPTATAPAAATLPFHRLVQLAVAVRGVEPMVLRRRLGISKGYLSRIMNGRCPGTPELHARILDELGVPPPAAARLLAGKGADRHVVHWLLSAEPSSAAA